MDIDGMLAEDARRMHGMTSGFEPLSGQGSTGERFLLEIVGLPLPKQWLPQSMRRLPMVEMMAGAGSLQEFCRRYAPDGVQDWREEVVRSFFKLRARHDFPFWAAAFARIKNKEGGPDVLFRLNPPQRKLVEAFESMRLNGEPIRVILLKARQWGGSTCTQLYMAWLQLMHYEGANSLVIAHRMKATDEIMDMYCRMVAAYPAWMLFPMGRASRGGGVRLQKVGAGGGLLRLRERNCKIKVGTAGCPDSSRGGDHSLVHLSEVGLWGNTPGRMAADTVRSACSGVLYRYGTMIVFESTANGTGTFFHTEYQAAKRGESQFRPLFVPWYDIPLYRLPVSDRRAFAASLIKGRSQTGLSGRRSVSGRYLWQLWQSGATLEGINWYIAERAKYNDQSQMAAEYPSDDVEAFAHSGQRVFDPFLIERLREGCSIPPQVGEIAGRRRKGREALLDVAFRQDAAGGMKVWRHPEPERAFADRYVCVVDIGGRSQRADWSVAAVFDRQPMLSGRGPEIVAQWRGHTDIDLLAWKAAAICRHYCDALLVIESNTAESHEARRGLEGEQSGYLLSQLKEAYPNLYARAQAPEEIRAGAPAKYGFHTNTATKPMVISALVAAVRDGGYTEHDPMCLDEMATYERRPNGSYGAIAGCHDDMLMTRAIGIHIINAEMDLPSGHAAGQVKTRRRHDFFF